jgi:hypothetical protein
MNYKAAVRRSSDPITATGGFKPVVMDSQIATSSTIDIRSASIGSELPERKWVNLALASILTLTPVNFLGPIEVYPRRRGAASVTIYDWIELDEDLEDSFFFPGGLIIPNSERKILFRKLLRLDGLEKRQPFVNL